METRAMPEGRVVYETRLERLFVVRGYTPSVFVAEEVMVDRRMDGWMGFEGNFLRCSWRKVSSVFSDRLLICFRDYMALVYIHVSWTSGHGGLFSVLLSALPTTAEVKV